jgi:hypothetical protein
MSFVVCRTIQSQHLSVSLIFLRVDLSMFQRDQRCPQCRVRAPQKSDQSCLALSTVRWFKVRDASFVLDHQLPDHSYIYVMPQDDSVHSHAFSEIDALWSSQYHTHCIYRQPRFTPTSRPVILMPRRPYTVYLRRL